MGICPAGAGIHTGLVADKGYDLVYRDALGKVAWTNLDRVAAGGSGDGRIDTAKRIGAEREISNWPTQGGTCTGVPGHGRAILRQRGAAEITGVPHKQSRRYGPVLERFDQQGGPRAPFTYRLCHRPAKFPRAAQYVLQPQLP